MFTKKFLRRVFMVDFVIFVVVGLFCLLFEAEYGLILMLSGFGIIVLGFMGSSSGARLQGPGVGIYMVEKQYLKELEDHDQINRLQSMLTDIIFISALPIIVGIILLMIF